MKENGQLVLFGAQTGVPDEFKSAVAVTPRYKYERVKGPDGKMVVVRDAKKNPVLVKGPDGNPVVSTVTIGLLPRKSESGADLMDVTGKSGQGLMQFERQARDLLCDEAIAEFVRLRASGQYTFARETRNRGNGALSLTIKPVFGGRSLASSPTDEIQAELERRGFKIVANEPEEEAPELPVKPSKPAKK